MPPQNIAPEVLSSSHVDSVTISKIAAASCCEHSWSNVTSDSGDFNGSAPNATLQSPTADEGGGKNMTVMMSVDDLTDFEAAIAVIVPVIFGLIAVLGFIGNLLVIVVVATSNRKRRSTTNILVSGLAVADLVFIIVCVPFTAVNFALGVWPFGTILCKIYQYVIHVTAHASVYTLVLMSVDRYLAVVHPICSLTLRTARNAAILLAIVWVIIVLANAPLFSDFAVLDYEAEYDNRSMCVNVNLLNEGSYEGRVYQVTFFAFAYLIPLTVICLLYGCLVCRLLRGVDRSSANKNGRGGSDATTGTGNTLVVGRQSETMRARRRVTRMVVVVVAVFAICWLPWQTASMIQSFIDHRSPLNHSVAFAGFKIASNCLAYLNSCVNPILYAFLSDNFRNDIATACSGGMLGWPGGCSSGAAANGDGRTGRRSSSRHRRKRGQRRGVVDRIAAAESDRSGSTGGWFRMVRRSERLAPPSGALLTVRHGSEDVTMIPDATSARSMSTGTLRLPAGISVDLAGASSTVSLVERMNDTPVETASAKLLLTPINSVNDRQEDSL